MTWFGIWRVSQMCEYTAYWLVCVKSRYLVEMWLAHLIQSKMRGQHIPEIDNILQNIYKHSVLLILQNLLSLILPVIFFFPNDEKFKIKTWKSQYFLCLCGSYFSTLVLYAVLMNLWVHWTLSILFLSLYFN